MPGPRRKPHYLFFIFLFAALGTGVFNAYASMLDTAVVVTYIPNAPSGLSASASSQSQIDLSWTDNSTGETGFVIERSTGDNTNFSPVASTSPNVSTWSDTGLAASTLYFYRVKATGP